MTKTRLKAGVGATAVAVVALASAVAPASSQAVVCPYADNQFANLTAGQATKAMECLVNSQRAAHGVGPVATSVTLSKAAQKHSDYLVSSQSFGHTDGDGKSFGARFTAAGFNWINASENIGAGQLTPDALILDWLKSKVHCKNTLSPKYTFIGFGFTKSSTGSFRAPTTVLTLARKKGNARAKGTEPSCPVF